MKAYSNKVREVYKNGFDKKNLNVLYTPTVYRVKRYKRRPTDKQRGEFILENIDGSNFIPYGEFSQATGKKSFFESELQRIDYDKTTEPSNISNSIDADYMNFIIDDDEFNSQVTQDQIRKEREKKEQEKKARDKANPQQEQFWTKPQRERQLELAREQRAKNKANKAKEKDKSKINAKPKVKTTIKVAKPQRKAKQTQSPPDTSNPYARTTYKPRARQVGGSLVLRNLLEYQMGLQERFKSLMTEI